MSPKKQSAANPCRPCRSARIRSFDMLTSIKGQITYLAKSPNNMADGEFVSLQAQCPTGILWTIRQGDTFFGIAQLTGANLERIIALNPGVDPNALQVGMTICLPEEAALPRGPIPPCQSGLFWVVFQGDTLFTIAETSGTTVERLLELNPGIDPLNLQFGMSICLPG